MAKIDKHDCSDKSKNSTETWVLLSSLLGLSYKNLVHILPMKSIGLSGETMCDLIPIVGRSRLCILLELGFCLRI